MSTSKVLKRYEDLLGVSETMLRVAQEGEWEHLIEVEALRASIVEELKQTDTMQWSGPDAEKKAEVIRLILSVDEQTRILAEAGKKVLEAHLGSIETGKKLNKAYGAL